MAGLKTDRDTRFVRYVYDTTYDEQGGSEGLLAMIIPSLFRPAGVEALTEAASPVQAMMIGYPAGTVIQNHYHPPMARNSVGQATEVLYIKKGILRARIFNSDRKLIETVDLYPGDVLILIRGGHGFDVVESVEILEVRQGPYLGPLDKVRW